MTGEELKNMRTEMGIKQRKLGELTGLTNVTISNFESGSKPIPPSKEKLFKQVYESAMKSATVTKAEMMAFIRKEVKRIEINPNKLASESGLSHVGTANYLDKIDDEDYKPRIETVEKIYKYLSNRSPVRLDVDRISELEKKVALLESKFENIVKVLIQ